MKNITKKLIEIQKEVRSLVKTGVNDHFGYKYIEERVVVETVREKLIEKNLVVVPDVRDVNVTYLEKMILTTIKVDFTVVDVDTGETMTITMYGQGADSTDKGIYKAITGANKYFYLKLLNIPTLDDPEKPTEIEKTGLSNGDLRRAVAGKLLSATNHNKQDAVKLLQRLTGKSTTQDLTEQEARKIIDTSMETLKFIATNLPNLENVSDLLGKDVREIMAIITGGV